MSVCCCSVCSTEEVSSALVDGYSGRYIATACGKIYSHASGRCLKPRPCKSGYDYVFLSLNSKVKTRSVHRLVAASFLGQSELEVNHLDGNKSNNAINNLEFVTSSENKKHAFKLGLIKVPIKRGSNAPKAKLNSGEVIEIYSSPESLRELANKYGVTYQSIRNIKKHKTWKHITENIKARGINCLI